MDIETVRHESRRGYADDEPYSMGLPPLGNCTIRWQRGNKVAYIFEGKQLEAVPMNVDVLAAIPVSPKGWTDLVRVRLTGRELG